MCILRLQSASTCLSDFEVESISLHCRREHIQDLSEALQFVLIPKHRYGDDFCDDNGWSSCSFNCALQAYICVFVFSVCQQIRRSECEPYDCESPVQLDDEMLGRGKDYFKNLT